MVIVAPSADDRELLISRLAVRLGFAKVPSDAKKIIRKDIYSVDLATAYFVLCSNYSFRSSIITTQRLYELAARGSLCCSRRQVLASRIRTHFSSVLS